MRRLLLLLLCVSLLPLPAGAADAPQYVALTFDDGPSGRFTRALLEGLEDRNARATFLLCGYRMEQYPELVTQILDGGHEIGIHGYSHKCMGKMCADALVREIDRCRGLLPEGCQPVFLRPPGGILNNAVRQVAKDAGLAILSWSVDPRDWATAQAGAVEAAVLNAVKDGDVVLLHDMSDSSVEAALAIVDALQARGFLLVTASELAAARQITPKAGVVYARFPFG